MQIIKKLWLKMSNKKFYKIFGAELDIVSTYTIHQMDIDYIGLTKCHHHLMLKPTSRALLR